MSMQTLLAMLLVVGPVVSACAHARTPEEEPTPQIRVVPGAASRSLWIGHGAAGDAGADASAPSAPSAPSSSSP